MLDSNPFGNRSFFHDDHRKVHNEKILQIRHISTTSNESDYLLKFEIKTNNLKSRDAIIFVIEVEVIFSETAIPPTLVKIAPSAIQTVTLQLSKKKEFSKTLLEGNFEFRATITCDGLSAETKEFQLKVKQEYNQQCLCKKMIWSASDLQSLISELRKKEGTGYFQILRDKENTKNFKLGEPIKDEDGRTLNKELSIYDSFDQDSIQISDRLFYLKSDENIQTTERNYLILSQWINYIFRETNAVKCINKIHIITQIYHETQRLGSTFESDSSAKKSGEDFFRGRGLIMITNMNNYKSFYKHLYSKDPTENELKLFSPLLSSSIEIAAKSTVWYLNKLNIQKYFNEDDVNNVSAVINYPKALLTKNYDSIYGMKERRHFFELIKKIIGYEECK